MVHSSVRPMHAFIILRKAVREDENGLDFLRTFRENLIQSNLYPKNLWRTY